MNGPLNVDVGDRIQQPTVIRITADPRHSQDGPDFTQEERESRNKQVQPEHESNRQVNVVRKNRR